MTAHSASTAIQVVADPQEAVRCPLCGGDAPEPLFYARDRLFARLIAPHAHDRLASAVAQVQRLGNPLINEVIIGTGSKDRFSMDAPYNDAQFANFFLNPLLAGILSSIGVPVPPAPRTDLLPLVQYIAPICPGCKPFRIF